MESSGNSHQNRNWTRWMTLFALSSLVILLGGCAAPVSSLAPQPTYTALPTYTPYPTFTPVPTSTTASLSITATTLPANTASRANSPTPPMTIPQLTATPATLTGMSTPSASLPRQCIDWAQAGTHMNESTCVRGVVFKTYQSGSTFFIDFDDTRTSFYGVSFSNSWENLKGQCVELKGRIADYRGRPQIVIDRKDQLSLCN